LGALFLDVRHRLISDAEAYRGTLHRASVEPREILKECLLRGAAGVVLFHTHPSGDPTPSSEDVNFSQRWAVAAGFVGVELVDHGPGQGRPLRVLEAEGRMVKPTVTLDRKIFDLCRAIAITHEVPLRDLVEEVLLAAFMGEEAFHPSEQDAIDMLSRIYLPGMDKLAARRLKGGILTRERRPKRRRRRQPAQWPHSQRRMSLMRRAGSTRMSGDRFKPI
jgi:hypothetical protein